MATLHRDGKAFIRATLIRALLSGDAQCEWAAWFQGRHDNRSWTKQHSTFDFENWRQKHNLALQETRDRWEQEGYTTTIEDQNQFRMDGNSAVLVGKPDLIVRKGNKGIVIDAKTGTPREADKFQVMLYMWAVSKFPHLRQQVEQFEGIVEYPGVDEVRIPASAINQDFVDSIVGLIRRLSDDKPARRVPSLSECRFCDITSEDCPERIDEMDIEIKIDDF